MIRILIADDHPIVREGLKRIVADCGDMEVVGEATNAADLEAQLPNERIDVLLLDVSMPGPGFLDTMRMVKVLRPKLPVLVNSVVPENLLALRALRAGARGYLTKDRSPEELAEAIRRVHQGGRYVTQSLAEQLASELDPDAEGNPHDMLSEREYQVLCGLGAGHTVGDLADSMALSPKTISTYRTRILSKMNLQSNAELIRYAVKHGIVD